ncbi:MAG: 50S ribosomal protein L32 [Planctomycetota bacterium]|uniref:50S ribosomal protein L32 n=1 Tax=Candidatus Avalokitesvara rifleensis TaxID=3367620 RepID=UPI000EE85F5D|nr:50S ribosomal protein L32 [Planctomycetia bacterium]
MPNPKRKHSVSRGRKRRTHDRLIPPNIPSFQRAQGAAGDLSKRFICPQCKHIKMSHTICHNCGYYNGRQVIAVERV